MAENVTVKFGDLALQYRALKAEMDAAIFRVLERGQFILGGEVEAFEKEFSAYCGTRHGVGVASGTEALYLSLLAAGVKPGDEVITAPNTAVPTASAITMAGAKPVFADVLEEDFNINPEKIAAAATKKTKAIIPVHLYGQTADMKPVLEVAERLGLSVVEDACQAHGAEYERKKAGSFGDFGCFSFYPSKNLGAYGDAGFVATSDPAQHEKLLMLRNYGQKKRYYHEIKGVNGRLDEIQAAILRVKLKHLDEWNAKRIRIAGIYAKNLCNAVTLPATIPGRKHVYHIYAARTRNNAERDALKKFLEERGVQTLIHYPIPIHLQEAYADLRRSEGDYPVAEGCARTELSLPIYPELSDEQTESVWNKVNEFF